MSQETPETISLRDLRSFLTVVEEGTFTDAAIALGTTQASVSRHVGALERALGARLLLRGGRIVSLTRAGQRVLRHARTIRLESEAIHRAAKGEDREIRVGYSWAALGAHTPAVQKRWAQEHPGTELTFVSSETRFAGLTEGLADVVVTRRDPGLRQIATALLGHEDRVAALPAEHPLARKRRLRLTDLVGETVALNTVTGTTTEDLWTPGQAPGAYRPVAGTDEWLTVIAAGQALGVTSRATWAQYRRTGIVFRTLVDAPLLPVWLLWWRDDPPWFVDELCELFREAYRAEDGTMGA